VRSLASERLDGWRTAHPDRRCPDFAAQLGPDDAMDPWGHAYLLDCRAANPIVISAGPDGRWGTPDDLRSDRPEPEE
jgi:hypothetical protein